MTLIQNRADTYVSCDDDEDTAISVNAEEREYERNECRAPTHSCCQPKQIELKIASVMGKKDKQMK